MRINMVGAFIRNAPFGSEIAFKKGLERLGHEVIPIDTSYPDQIWDQNADATVVFKWMEGYWDKLQETKGLKIVYQPDDARFPHIREMILKMRPYADCLLSFDDNGATVAKTMGYRAAETLLLTADDELYSPSIEPIERDIDVSFIGSLGGPISHASRQRMIEVVYGHAKKKGWKTAFGQTEDMQTILDTYRRSKVVLNHATDVGQPFGSGFGLQCRHFEVGMTRTAVLSNELLGDAPKMSFVRFRNEESLISELTRLIEGHEDQMYDDDYGRPLWQVVGERVYKNIRHAHMPEHRGAQLINFIERNR